jgi:hypothetical protein
MYTRLIFQTCYSTSLVSTTYTTKLKGTFYIIFHSTPYQFAHIKERKFLRLGFSISLDMLRLPPTAIIISSVELPELYAHLSLKLINSKRKKRAVHELRRKTKTVSLRQLLKDTAQVNSSSPNRESESINLLESPSSGLSLERVRIRRLPDLDGLLEIPLKAAVTGMPIVTAQLSSQTGTDDQDASDVKNLGSSSSEVASSSNSP